MRPVPARMTAISISGAPLRSSASKSVASGSGKSVKEKFPELRDAEMAPGGVLKILDDIGSGETVTKEKAKEKQRAEALRG
jgi:hypothetical protein